MTAKTKGITIWDGLPHPAQPKTSATIDVVVDETFWRRVERHINDEPQSWRELLPPSPSPGTPGEGRGEGLHARLRESLRSALRQPCVMARVDPFTGANAWHVVLREGACVVLRFEAEHVHAADCFFIDTRESAIHPRDRQSAALKELIARHAPFDVGSRRVIIHHVPPAEGNGTGGDGSADSGSVSMPPAVWFLASPALLPITPQTADETFPLADLIGHAEPAGGSGYRDLLAFGQSKLFALPPVSVPSIQSALQAASELLQRLHQWSVPVHAADWKDASDAWREELRMRTIQRRTQAWAATIGLDAAYEFALLHDQDPIDLAAAIDACLDALDAFDASIESQAPMLLSRWSARDRHHWGSILADDYQTARLPWLACEKC